MAEPKRMTTEQVVGYLLEGEGLDFLRESLCWVVQQLMEAEVSELIGAERGERSTERLTHRKQQITHDLSAIGIDVDVKEFSLGHLIERASRPKEPYDILIAWWYVDYADPADVLNVLLDPHGNLSHFRSKRWDDELARVEQIAGQARYRSYAHLARKLERDVSPVIAYATGTTREFFSARVGCQAFNPVYGLDLAALCLRRVRPTR